MKINGKQADLSVLYPSGPNSDQQKLLEFLNAKTDGGYFSPAEVQAMMKLMNWTLPQLMNEFLVFAALMAVVPVSNYRVGALAHGISGAIYFGANVEFLNEALSFTVHAEQASIAHAISYGEQGIDYLAISAAPCGYCRQFLYEIIKSPFTPDINIIIGTSITKLSALLPQAFGPQDLGVTTRLMLPQDNNLQLSTSDPNVLNAFNAANSSYSPYTFDYSGVCIVTSSGSYSGSYSENAAYNPSLSPMEAALVIMVMNGQTFHGINGINRVILVEAANNKCSQQSATNAMMASVAPTVALEYYVVN